jgi:hypothetical protein
MISALLLVIALMTPQTVRLRFTDVFVRRSGRWLIVASQGTLLQP